MDNVKTGNLIRKLRVERNMTQQVLADKIGVSDKAVSKWERGLGCPDVSVLGYVASALGITLETLLDGDVNENEKDSGNMKKTKFYYCSNCGNTVIATGNPQLECCGKKLEAEEIQPCDEKHKLNVEYVEDEMYVTMSHEMIKSHYITFVAYQGYDRFYMVKTYAEQDLAVRMPYVRGGRFLIHCSKDGIFEQKQ